MNTTSRVVGALLGISIFVTAGCRSANHDASLESSDAIPTPGKTGACYSERFKSCVESSTMDISSECTVSGTKFMKKCPSGPLLGTCEITTEEGTKYQRYYKDSIFFPNVDKECAKHHRWIPGNK